MSWMQELDSDWTPGQLHSQECFWRDHQKWLQDCGYILRPRYMPDWKPSWTGSKKPYYQFEDSIYLAHPQTIDAKQISNGVPVALKKISKSLHPYEVKIGNFFSTDSVVHDPRNHCLSNLRVLQVPDDEDLHILVMPWLRTFRSPRFDTFGEAVEFFRQVFEGLQFMHEHRVAHRDCNARNIMMEASLLYPAGYHPREIERKQNCTGRAKHFTRTQRPPKYYFIDFGISRRYNLADGPPLEDPIWGGDKSVPEFHRSNDPCDPFPTDVYYLGNMIREEVIMKRFGFEFIEPLVADMVHDDPAKRPTMDEVVARFDELRRSLSGWKLRSRVVGRKDHFVVGIFRSVAYWTRRIGFIAKRVPPAPVP